MIARSPKMSAPRLAPILAVLLGLGSEAVAASSAYTVTDLGPTLDSAIVPGHPGLGMTLSADEVAKLPSVQVITGATYRMVTTFPMRPIEDNAAGTVIGTVPSGFAMANALNSLELGFTRMQADGTYGPFTGLTPANPFEGTNAGGIVGEVSLDSKNQILITNSMGQKLLDVATGTTTDVSTLLPPNAFGPGGFIHNAVLVADGSIFADVESPEFTSDHAFLLTPIPTPEPSTLATLLVAGLVALARATRRRPKLGA